MRLFPMSVTEPNTHCAKCEEDKCKCRGTRHGGSKVRPLFPTPLAQEILTRTKPQQILRE
jgi:hypothetical protein